MTEYTRWGWQVTWMTVADTVAFRSGCCRRKIGAVIVDPDNRIIATGYNGPPAGLRERVDYGLGPTRGIPMTCEKNCPRYTGKTEEGILYNPTADYGNCISIHAEANALLFCDRREREGGAMYVTSVPCYDCAKQIANSGVKEVYTRVTEADEHRHPQRSIDLLTDSGLEVIKWELAPMVYFSTE